MKILKIVLVTLFTTLSTFSNAIDQGYIGASFSKIYYQESDLLVPDQQPISVPDVNLSSLNILGGLSVKQNLSAELRFGFGMHGDSTDDVKLDGKWHLGAYAKYTGTTVNGFTPYGILGITRARVDAQLEADVIKVYESDVSFGAGVEYFLSNDNSLTLEFINLLDADNISINAISLGFKDFF